MEKLAKQLFINLVMEKAEEKIASSERRERLQGRLEKATIKAVRDVLPSQVVYNTTKNGNIKADYINLNIRMKNLHLFAHNTAAIQVNDLSNKYTIILVIKATYQGALRIKTEDIKGARVTLEMLQQLEKNGKAKRADKLSDALGL